MFVNDVLELIAEPYQVRYNVSEGILTGKSRIGDYDNSSVVTRSNNYRDSYITGSRNGNARGLEAGEGYAQSAAYNLADSDIGKAIDIAIDTKSQIVLKPNPRMIPFDGLNSNLSMPKDMVSRLADRKDSTQREVRRLLRSEVSSNLISELFDLRDIYVIHRTDIPEEFKFDRAFENWNRNIFNRSGRHEEIRRFYREIQDANVYERPRENELAFRQGFINHYSRQMDRAWRNKVSENNNRAHDLGQDLYVAAADALATDLGNFDGFNFEYRPATVQSFNVAFIPAYNSSYPRIVEKLRTSSHLTAIKATVIPTSGKAEVAYGDTLDVVVSSITNRGMVEGTAKVELVTQGQVRSSGATHSIVVSGISRDSEAKHYAQMGRVSAITGVDESFAATVNVAGTNFSVTLKSSYEEKIRRLSQTRDADVAKEILSKVIAQMKHQYDEMSGWNDQYEKRLGHILLVRIRVLFDKLSVEEKAQLQTHKKAFRNAFGSRPGPFSTKRDEWDSAYAMLKEMKMN